MNQQNSKHLCILVREDTKEVVNIKLPARTIGWIETLMPNHVLEKIQNKGIDLNAIKERAKRSLMQPQELFEMDSGKRTYKIWLE